MICEPRRWPPLDLAVRLTLAVREANRRGFIDGRLLADATRAAERLSVDDMVVFQEIVRPRGDA